MPLHHSVAGPVFAGGAALRLADGGEAAREANVPTQVPIGPLLIVPLGLGSSARGIISVANVPGGPVFSEGTQRLLEAFAGQAAVALELADRRRDTERLVLLEDRDRIAKDLHDTVIQRLFATAMGLMAAIKITQKREVAVRVQRAVDDLDDTMRQIRSTIFALQGPPTPSRCAAGCTSWSTPRRSTWGSRPRCGWTASWTRRWTMTSPSTCSPWCGRLCRTWPGTPRRPRPR